MRFYYVPAAPATDRWHRTQDDARRAARSASGGGASVFDIVEVPTDQKGLLHYLTEREIGDEMVRLGVTAAYVDASPPAPAAPSVALQSLQMDEAFDALPLARQLHFAAIAMENARASIKQ